MFAELAVATVMVLLTVVIHGAGLLALGHLMEWMERARGKSRISPVSGEGAVVAVLSALGLLVLHGIEIWLYALVYRVIGAVETVRDAVYFSTIAYASIGFSDAAMAPEWKLLGALEGINGALLLGWSVAFFVTLMTRFLPARRHDG
ncbi:ion channel [Brevundimonas sp. TWP2-3-4b1]|uniref:ion channel n=1 Tax=Brevundimonas sp. TWP2-3-4b1 TaxID=2804580 RepID=UPI003CEBE34B